MARGCKAWWLIPAAITLGHVLIGAVSYILWVRVAPRAPVLVKPLLPLSLCLAAAALATAVEAARLVGPRRFFCGGRSVLLDLLGLGEAEPPDPLVTSGPYGLLRHPVYSASVAGYACMVLAAPALLPGLPAVLAWAGLAAWAEDRVNMRSPRYRGYAARVPGFAPCRALLYGLRRLCGSVPRGGRSGLRGSGAQPGLTRRR